ncbi:hypothetical protein AB0Y20_08025 [Heyndrickxia oleronia]
MSQDWFLRQIKRERGEKCVSKPDLETNKERKRRKICFSLKLETKKG